MGFLLGLTSGTACLATCVPVLVPFMISEGKSVWQNFLDLIKFLSGRFLGYMIFSVLAWVAGDLFLKNPVYKEIIVALSFIVLSILMAFYSLSGAAHPCPVNSSKGLINWVLNKYPKLLPSVFGFLTGVNLCAPFLIAFTEAIKTGSLLGSMFFFLMFFLGTSVYFVPLPFISLLNRYKEMKIIGKMAVTLMSLYYLYTGIIMLIGGIKKI